MVSEGGYGQNGEMLVPDAESWMFGAENTSEDS